MRYSLKILAAGLLGSVAIFSSQAAADSIDVSSGPAISADGSFWKWSYTEQVSSSAQVDNGTYSVHESGEASEVAIIDFAGYVPGTNFQPLNWSFSAQLVTSPISGTDGSSVSHSDSPTVFNLVWTYTGTSPIAGQATLGNFGADSIYSLIGIGAQLARDTSTTSPTKGYTSVNSYTIGVPTAPLPATADMGLTLLAGLGGLGLLRRFRSRVA